jgi:hypothetical protein
LSELDQSSSSTINPEDSYSTVHHLRSAHDLTLGRGAKVAILDHSFVINAHPELYSGFQDFQLGEGEAEVAQPTYHGYWMALALHEVAPEAQIFALNTFSPDEMERVEAVVRALDWAIENDMDVVTHCAAGFSTEARAILDPAVERAVGAGVIVVFLDYEHPLNLLPAVMGQDLEEGTREPDLNIFSYDCTLDLGNITVGLLDTGDSDLVERRPFLSRSSAAPVAAGLVALVRSVDSTASPTRVKEVLKGTSRSVRIEGMAVAHVPDAFRAVKQVAGNASVSP